MKKLFTPRVRESERESERERERARVRGGEREGGRGRERPGIQRQTKNKERERESKREMENKRGIEGRNKDRNLIVSLPRKVSGDEVVKQLVLSVQDHRSSWEHNYSGEHQSGTRPATQPILMPARPLKSVRHEMLILSAVCSKKWVNVTMQKKGSHSVEYHA